MFSDPETFKVELVSTVVPSLRTPLGRCSWWTVCEFKYLVLKLEGACGWNESKGRGVEGHMGPFSSIDECRCT